MEFEVKLLIDDQHWKTISSLIQPDSKETKRDVWFFETPDKSLKQHEVLLRVRVSRKKDEAETTAKWRKFVSPYPEVLDEWLKIDEFKAEIDATGKDADAQHVPAWSISRKGLKESTFEVVKNDPRKIDRLFNEFQMLLVCSAWPALPADRLKCYGPVDSLRYNLKNGLFIERWVVGNSGIVEISCRGDDYHSALDMIEAWLAAAGIPGQGLPGGKTAWALDQLIKLNL